MECESTSSNMLAFRIQNNRTWFLPLKTLLLIIRVICVQIIELGKDCKGDVNKWLYKIKKKKQKELISLKVLGKVSWGRSHCSIVWKNEDICTKETDVSDHSLEHHQAGMPMSRLWAVLGECIHQDRKC